MISARGKPSGPYTLPRSQVVVARVDESAGDGSGLGDDTVVADDPGKDQDPMFSPDSSEVVYGHVNPEENTLAEELRVVGVDGGAARTLPPPPGLDYLSVPAWSRR